jgi:hypothetical protein
MGRFDWSEDTEEERQREDSKIEQMRREKEDQNEMEAAHIPVHDLNKFLCSNVNIVLQGDSRDVPTIKHIK